MENKHGKKAIKALVIVLLSTAAFVCLVARGCYAAPKKEVIARFERNRESFQVIADFFNTFQQEKYENKFRDMAQFSGYHFIHVKGRWELWPRWQEGENADSMPDDENIKAALHVLFGLGYDWITRQAITKNTVIFLQDSSKLEFPLESGRRQGICYSIDGKAPRPTTHYENYVDEIVPLGDGWYYWHGYNLYGHSRPGMPAIDIAFDE